MIWELFKLSSNYHAFNYVNYLFLVHKWSLRRAYTYLFSFSISKTVLKSDCPMKVLNFPWKSVLNLYFLSDILTFSSCEISDTTMLTKVELVIYKCLSLNSNHWYMSHKAIIKPELSLTPCTVFHYYHYLVKTFSNSFVLFTSINMTLVVFHKPLLCSLTWPHSH